MLDCHPTRKGALEPMLPVVVHGSSKHDHEGELEEEHTVEDERFPINPRLQSLCDDVGATIDHESRPAGD